MSECHPDSVSLLLLSPDLPVIVPNWVESEAPGNPLAVIIAFRIYKSEAPITWAGRFLRLLALETLWLKECGH